MLRCGVRDTDGRCTGSASSATFSHDVGAIDAVPQACLPNQCHPASGRAKSCGSPAPSGRGDLPVLEPVGWPRVRFGSMRISAQAPAERDVVGRAGHAAFAGGGAAERGSARNGGHELVKRDQAAELERHLSCRPFYQHRRRRRAKRTDAGAGGKHAKCVVRDIARRPVRRWCIPRLTSATIRDRYMANTSHEKCWQDAQALADATIAEMRAASPELGSVTAETKGMLGDIEPRGTVFRAACAGSGGVLMRKAVDALRGT